MQPADENLAELFWAVARSLRHLTKETLEPLHVSPSHSRALTVLLRHGPMRPGALAEHLRIAPRSATEVVDDLQQRGLVERAPDPADRRATLLHLTPAGTAIGDAIREARHATAERFFAGLSGVDRAELARILRQLRE
ncbi:MarR family transcriptional regulator [Amorphoplanes nipponensis]|uniref:Transcriptional regulator, MarR family protein n=1 Tax=Actinoplanes nipponensis TaxID=135950 RepID=A0A919MR15_9ACTN|nr:MarR family transcriptional regulator [Actinoplanes nipponensis]GIE53752.1 putative transcriptional regulator, MarR family protein [Actinoplanes nipponensis]